VRDSSKSTLIKACLGHIKPSVLIVIDIDIDISFLLSHHLFFDCCCRSGISSCCKSIHPLFFVTVILLYLVLVATRCLSVDNSHLLKSWTLAYSESNYETISIAALKTALKSSLSI
jgi:hypothetical protein